MSTTTILPTDLSLGAGWKLGTSARNLSNGEPALMAYTYDVNTTASFSFRGQGLSWLGWIGNRQGQVQLQIDDLPPATIDANGPEQPTITISTIWQTTGLPSGSHTAQIWRAANDPRVTIAQWANVYQLIATHTGGGSSPTSTPSASSTASSAPSDSSRLATPTSSLTPLAIGATVSTTSDADIGSSQPFMATTSGRVIIAAASIVAGVALLTVLYILLTRRHRRGAQSEAGSSVQTLRQWVEQQDALSPPPAPTAKTDIESRVDPGFVGASRRPHHSAGSRSKTPRPRAPPSESSSASNMPLSRAFPMTEVSGPAHSSREQLSDWASLSIPATSEIGSRRSPSSRGGPEQSRWTEASLQRSYLDIKSLTPAATNSTDIKSASSEWEWNGRR